MSIYYVDGQPHRVHDYERVKRVATTTNAEAVRAWRARNPERARQQDRDSSGVNVLAPLVSDRCSCHLRQTSRHARSTSGRVDYGQARHEPSATPK